MRGKLLLAAIVAVIIQIATPSLSSIIYQSHYSSSTQEHIHDDYRPRQFCRKVALLGKNLRAKVSGIWGRKSTNEPLSNSLSTISTQTTTSKPLPTGLLASITSLANHHLPALDLSKLGAKKRKKKLLILMSDTGGGHRASAQALDQAIQKQFPGKIEVEIMDIWTKHAGWPYNKFVPVYRYLAKHPMLWRGFFAYGTFPLTRKLTEVASWRNSYEFFKAAIENANPDFVVSVHPLCQLMPISIIQEINKRDRIPNNKPPIPFVTVVTDLGGAHNTWFDPRADAIYVPSEAVRQLALKNRFAPHKVLLKGLPIRPTFWKDALPKTEIRAKLNIPVECKTVLLMGGGDGVGGIEPIATALAAKLEALTSLSTQLVVVCGHNQQLANKLEQKLQTSMPNVVKSEKSLSTTAASRAIAAPPLPSVLHKVTVKGFVHNIDEYMGAADLLVTKAGPGTIAEAMARGLPLVLSTFLPGQVCLTICSCYMLVGRL